VRLEADAPFDEPWQARLFALTQAVLEVRNLDQEQFRQRLIASISGDTHRPYWESWLLALECLVVDTAIAAQAELTSSHGQSASTN
jgi:hypothetical protein